MRIMKEVAEAIDGKQLETGSETWQLSVADIKMGRVYLVLERNAQEKNLCLRFDPVIWNENRVWGIDWDSFADWLLPELASRVKEVSPRNLVELAVCEEGLREAE